MFSVRGLHFKGLMQAALHACIVNDNMNAYHVKVIQIDVVNWTAGNVLASCPVPIL